jgi:hypothetical protein
LTARRNWIPVASPAYDLRIISDKSEKLLIWGEAVTILIVLALVFAPHVTFTENRLLRLFSDKFFDILLALFGTLLGYWLAKRHIEHLMAGIVKTLDTKYLNLFRERAFHRAVSAMLPELPDFHLRKTNAFSTQTADALSEFTHYSAAVDPTHTAEKSMELVGKEAYTLAAKLIAKDMAFKEEASTGNYEWIVEIGGLPAAGWEIEETPDLSIYDWNTGVAVQRYALMEETARTATTIRYSWKWNMKDVPCGVYVGVVNYMVVGHPPVIGNTVGERVKIFLVRENGKIIKKHEATPWG